MKYAVKLLKEAIKKQLSIKETAIKKDSYKGVIESDKNIKDLNTAINVLTQKPASTKKKQLSNHID